MDKSASNEAQKVRRPTIHQSGSMLDKAKGFEAFPPRTKNKPRRVTQTSSEDRAIAFL